MHFVQVKLLGQVHVLWISSPVLDIPKLFSKEPETMNSPRAVYRSMSFPVLLAYQALKFGYCLHAEMVSSYCFRFHFHIYK